MSELPPFRLDLVNQCMWRRGDGADDQPILLTPKAFAMLHYLVEHAGRRLANSKKSLPGAFRGVGYSYDDVWGGRLSASRIADSR